MKEMTESRSLLNILRDAIVILVGLCSLGGLIAIVAKPSAFGAKSRKGVILAIFFWLSVIMVSVGVWTLVDRLRQP
jgi:hypothetical protein